MTKVQVSGELNASAQQVWDSLKGFDLNYLPGFKHTVAGQGLGATRTFDPGRGETQEKIENFDPDTMSFSYTMTYGSLPVSDYHATVQVHPLGPTSCRLDWSATFEPRGLPEEKAARVIRGTFDMNITALKNHLG